MQPPRQLFTKKNNAPPSLFGKLPNQRTISELLTYSIINLDKPAGPTSHQVSDMVKKLMNVPKAGHSGTLDPQVTGVQPIAIGRATRIVEFLLTAPKEYVGIMHLHHEVQESVLREAVASFTGKISQLPPIKSAIKRELRTREIYEFEMLEMKNQDVLFRVKCQAGTYIRKLCHDLGKTLTVGAHMVQLRRTKAGPFTENDHLVTLNDLQDALYFYQNENNDKFLRHCLQPIENALTYIPKCYVHDSAITSLTHGRVLSIPGITKLENFRKGEDVAILTGNQELIAIGTALLSAVEINTKEKGNALKIKKVFLEPIVTEKSILPPK